jgi:hypothetical protein
MAPRQSRGLFDGYRYCPAVKKVTDPRRPTAAVALTPVAGTRRQTISRVIRWITRRAAHTVQVPYNSVTGSTLPMLLADIAPSSSDFALGRSTAAMRTVFEAAMIMR